MPDYHKNLLMVSYYFPPMGLGGVQRAAKTAKYLDRLGWKVQVLAGSDKGWILRDDSLLAELPESIKIHTISDPLARPQSVSEDDFEIKGKSGFVQKLIRLPDSKVFWTRKAYPLAERLIEKKNIKYLLTSAPPPSLNIIGLRLKNRFRIKWLADFRDPWFADESPPLTPWHARLRSRLEANTLAQADYISCVSADHVADLARRYPRAEPKIVHIPNGYDSDDFAEITSSIPDKLIFAHCGTLCSLHGVRAFFEAVTALIAADNSLRKLLEFHQIGAVHEDIGSLLRQHYSHALHISFHGYLNHKAALKQLAQAAIAVVFGGVQKPSPLIIPGKLYESLALSKPVVVVAEEGSAAEAVIAQMPGCYRLNPDDPEQMSATLLELVAGYRAGQLYNQSRLPLIEKYNREFQARQFARLLEE